MIKLLSSINTRLDYISNNSKNAYILKQVEIVRMKMKEFADWKYSTPEVVDKICDKIVSYDISNMKRVSGETNMVYKKMDELAGFVQDIKVTYFAENEFPGNK